MTTTVPSLPEPTSKSVQLHQSPVRSTRLIAMALAAFLLIVYASFPTRNHYWDGIGFALNIEGAGQDAKGIVPNDLPKGGASGIYFNPNHLLHNLIAYSIYTPIHMLLPDVRALDVLRAISVVSSVATAVLVFLMLARSSRDLHLSAWLTLLMAFSATWWKFSTDANAYVPSVFLLVLCGFLLTIPQKRPQSVTIGLLHALSILVEVFPDALLDVPEQVRPRARRQCAGA